MFTQIELIVGFSLIFLGGLVCLLGVPWDKNAPIRRIFRRKEEK